jgi:hypothetical protein
VRLPCIGPVGAPKRVSVPPVPVPWAGARTSRPHRVVHIAPAVSAARPPASPARHRPSQARHAADPGTAGRPSCQCWSAGSGVPKPRTSVDHVRPKPRAVRWARRKTSTAGSCHSASRTAVGSGPPRPARLPSLSERTGAKGGVAGRGKGGRAHACARPWPSQRASSSARDTALPRSEEGAAMVRILAGLGAEGTCARALAAAAAAAASASAAARAAARRAATIAAIFKKRWVLWRAGSG